MSDDAPSKLGYAAPLEYSQPAAARPGIITAIGVLSIVLGALSALTNLAGAR